MFSNQSTNDEILAAIQGNNPSTPQTTLSTGLASSGMPSAPNPLDTNPNYMNTLQNFFSMPQPGQANTQPQNNMFGALTGGNQQRHTSGVGRDNWGSGMSLDMNSIINSLGLGG